MAKPPLPGPNRDPWPDALWDHPYPDIHNTVNLGDEGLANGDIIDSYFDTHFADNTKIEIPSGTYTLSDQSSFSTSHSDIWIQGQGGLGGVTLEAGNDKNIVWSVSGDNTILIEDIDITGFNHSRIVPEAMDEPGEVVMKRFRHRDGNAGIWGSAHRPDPDNCSALSSGSPGHVGTLRFLWCEMTDAGNNGLYSDGPINADAVPANEGFGQVIVVGGYYHENNISNVRVGMPYSTVYRATVKVEDGVSQADVPRNHRGIWVPKPKPYPEGACSEPPYNFEYDRLIANCDIYFPPGAGSIPIKITNNDDWVGTGMVTNCRILNDAGSYAIHAGEGTTGKWTYNNIHLNGSNVDTSYNVDLENSPTPNTDAAEMPDTTPWWGIEEDSNSTTPTITDNEFWKRRYTSEIDHFEAGSLTAPYNVRFGSKSVFVPDETVTAPGSSRSMRVDNDGTSNGIYSRPGMDLHRHPERGRPFEFYFQQDAVKADNPNAMAFFVEGSTDVIESGDEDGYYLELVNGDIVLKNIKDPQNDSMEELDRVAVGYSANVWNRCRVESTDTDITIRVYDDADTELGSLTVNDDRWDGRGFWLWARYTQDASTEKVWFDQFDMPDVTPDVRVDNFHTEDLAAYDRTEAQGTGLMFDDFEDYDTSTGIEQAYKGHDTYAKLDTDAPIEGSASMRWDTDFARIGWDGDGGDTPRGESYSFLLETEGASHPGALFEVQEPFDDGAFQTGAYAVRLDIKSDEIFLAAYSDDGATIDEMETKVIDPLSANTVYRGEVDYLDAAGDARFEVDFYEHDSDTLVGSLNYTFTVANHSGGVFGFVAGREYNDRLDRFEMESGTSKVFDLTDKFAHEAPVSLEWNGAENGTEVLESQSGLDAYPDVGDSAQFQYYNDSAGAKDITTELRTLVHGTDETYLALELDKSAGDVNLWLMNQGTETLLDSSGVTFIEDNWNPAAIAYDGDTARVEVETKFQTVNLAGSVGSVTFGTGIAWAGTGSAEDWRVDSLVIQSPEHSERDGGDDGDTEDPPSDTEPPSVDTVSESDIKSNKATFTGELTNFGGYSEADCFFQYRVLGTNEWTDTFPETRTDTGMYTHTVAGLDPDTTYEWRAAAEGVK